MGNEGSIIYENFSRDRIPYFFFNRVLFCKNGCTRTHTRYFFDKNQWEISCLVYIGFWKWFEPVKTRFCQLVKSKKFKPVKTNRFKPVKTKWFKPVKTRGFKPIKIRWLEPVKTMFLLDWVFTDQSYLN